MPRRDLMRQRISRDLVEEVTLELNQQKEKTL